MKPDRWAAGSDSLPVTNVSLREARAYSLALLLVALCLRVFVSRHFFQMGPLPYTGWLTLLLAALFVAGVYEPTVASILVTVYFTWKNSHTQILRGLGSFFALISQA